MNDKIEIVTGNFFEINETIKNDSVNYIFVHNDFDFDYDELKNIANRILKIKGTCISYGGDKIEGILKTRTTADDVLLSFGTDINIILACNKLERNLVYITENADKINQELKKSEEERIIEDIKKITMCKTKILPIGKCDKKVLNNDTILNNEDKNKLTKHEKDLIVEELIIQDVFKVIEENGVGIVYRCKNKNRYGIYSICKRAIKQEQTTIRYKKNKDFNYKISHIAWIFWGGGLPGNRIIHHHNENHFDNSKDNLFIGENSSHSVFHQTGKLEKNYFYKSLIELSINNCCTLSNKEFTQKLGVSIRTISRELAKLKRQGLIKIERIGNIRKIILSIDNNKNDNNKTIDKVGGQDNISVQGGQNDSELQGIDKKVEMSSVEQDTEKKENDTIEQEFLEMEKALAEIPENKINQLLKICKQNNFKVDKRFLQMRILSYSKIASFSKLKNVLQNYFNEVVNQNMETFKNYLMDKFSIKGLRR